MNLPGYLFPAPGQQASISIDHGACQEVASKFNVKAETVRMAVENQISNSDSINPTDELSRYVVAYRLIIDNKVLQQQAPDFYVAPNTTTSKKGSDIFCIKLLSSLCRKISNLEDGYPEEIAQQSSI